MRFREGDSVMHWTFGLGKVIRLEEKNVSGKELPYYAVQIGEMTIWVPVDEMLETRLRRPTASGELKKLKKILAGAGEPLPDDRHQRKIMLVDILKDGSAESLCRVIRSLVSYQKVHPLNENDKELLARSQKALIGELGVALSVTPLDAGSELQRFLSG